SFVLTCTRYNFDYLRSFLPPALWQKIHVIYHGIDLSAFRSNAPFADSLIGQTAASENTPLMLSVGRLVPKKGLKDLIAACGVLRDRGVPFECAIVGEGPLRSELESQVASLDLSGVVRLIGAMAHERLIPLYRKATVFALPPQVTEDGDRDGIPNVLVE